MRKSSSKRVEWKLAPDINKRVNKIISSLETDWIKPEDIHCMRSENSKARAYARIWGLSKVFQISLKQSPSYVIEVISEKFDRLDKKRQDEVLIHELAHIPKTFSGSLVPHKRKGKFKFHDRVREMVRKYNK